MVNVRAFGSASFASSFSTARVHATASAARPAADDARPAAVGKLFREYTMKRTGDPSTGAGRIASKILIIRFDTTSNTPFSTNTSPPFPLPPPTSMSACLTSTTSVIAAKSSTFMVPLMLELIGMIRSSSFLPQYLMTAMFGAVAVYVYTSAFEGGEGGGADRFSGMTV